MRIVCLMCKHFSHTEQIALLNELLQQKKSGQLPKAESPRILGLDKWIDQMFLECQIFCKSLEDKKPPATTEFNDVACATITKYNKKEII